MVSAGGLVMEEKIGHVSHYYNRIGVAAIQIEHGELKKGDRIHIVGRDTDTEQVVTSMELEHHSIDEVHEGKSIGVKLEDRVHEKDEVYKTYI